MASYKEHFERIQREAKEKFQEIDKQIGLTDKLNEGAKVVRDVAEVSVSTLGEGVEKIKTEAQKSDIGKQAVHVAEETFKTAESTAKTAWKAAEPIRDAAGEASDKAAEVIKTAAGSAGEVIENAAVKAEEFVSDAKVNVSATTDAFSKAYNFGASWARALDSSISTVRKTAEWIAEKPLQAVSTGASVAVGAGLGVVFTGISSHWLFNSALPAWSVKKVTEQFQNHLKEQDELARSGNLTAEEREKLDFERDLAKYFGAPMLGAFSFASGAVLWSNIFNPRTITGAPISWILGGNPILEGVWLFSNGAVCFKSGYDLFMFSLEDHDDVQKIIREVKGLIAVSV